MLCKLTNCVSLLLLQSFLVFIDSQCSDTVGILQVLPSETVESLIARIRKQFSELCLVDLKYFNFSVNRFQSLQETEDRDDGFPIVSREVRKRIKNLQI